MGGYLLNITMLCVALLFANGQSSPPFSLTIHMKGGDTFKSGSPISIQIVLTNTSKGNIFEIREKALDAGEMVGYTLSLHDQKGDKVPFTKFGEAFFAGTTITLSSPSYANLKPGDTLNNEIVLTNLFELRKPGTYTVQVQLKDLDSPRVGKSNTVSFTIASDKH